MGTYTGDPTAVTTPISRSVSGATNASPIVVTTTAPHLFNDGDKVGITGVVGNTAANGEWTIAKLTSTTFSLNGSTGNGAYVSGGTAVDRSLTPAFQTPADGEDLDVASVMAALETLADRSQYLQIANYALRAGYIIADIVFAAGDATTGPLIHLTDGGTTTQTLSLLSGGAATKSGDIVVTLFALPMKLSAHNAGSDLEVSIQLRANQNGAGLADISGAKAQVGAPILIISPAPVTAATTLLIHATVAGVFTVATPGTLAIAAKLDLADSDSGDDVQSVAGGYTAFYVLLRKIT